MRKVKNQSRNPPPAKPLDKAFQAFFERRQSGAQKAGYPRFKSRTQFNSFEFKQYKSGVKLDGRWEVLVARFA